MKKLHIRKANEEDLENLLLWGRKVFEVEKKFSPLLKYSASQVKERYSKQIRDPKYLFLIAELNNKGVGYLYSHLDPVEYLNTERPQCELEVIYLEPSARSKGLAQKLINECVGWAKKNNAFAVTAGIFAANTSSRKCFEKYGFLSNHVTYLYKL